MKTKCYSVKLKSIISISEKCYKAVCYDGSEDLIPKSQVFGQDYEVLKTDAYWISEWILVKKNLQYSSKKVCWFDDLGNKTPHYEIIRHIPNEIEPKKINPDESLTR